MINLRRRRSRISLGRHNWLLLSNIDSVVLYSNSQLSANSQLSGDTTHSLTVIGNCLLLSKKYISWNPLQNIVEKTLMHSFDEFFREIVMAWISANYLLQKTQQTNPGKVAQSVYRISKFSPIISESHQCAPLATSLLYNLFNKKKCLYRNKAHVFDYVQCKKALILFYLQVQDCYYRVFTDSPSLSIP